MIAGDVCMINGSDNGGRWFSGYCRIEKDGDKHEFF